MSHGKEQTRALVEVWDVLLRFRWRFIIPAFLVTCLVLAGAMLIPRKYKGEAILERRTDMVLAELTSRGASHSFQDPRQSLVNELTGPHALERVMASLRPLAQEGRLGRRLAADPDSLEKELRHAVTVSYDLSTLELDRVRVSLVTDHPLLAQVVVNTIVRNYIDSARRDMEQRLRQSAAFFQAEVDRERQVIDELENRVLEFEIAHADLLPDNPTNLQTTLADAQGQLAQAEQDLAGAVLREESLRQSLAETVDPPATVVMNRNPELDRLGAKKQALETQLASYLQEFKMTAKHPDLLVLRQQIADLDAQIAQTPAEVVVSRQTAGNSQRAELDLLLARAVAERQAMASRHTALQERVAEMSGQSPQLFPVRSDYRKMIREVEQHQRQLAFWEENLRRVDMAQAAESGDRGVRLQVLKECGPLDRPVSPDLAQVIAAALGLGLLAGAAAVYFAHRTDESFRNAERLAERFNLPLFGSVSELISAPQRRVRRLRNLLLYPLNAAALASVVLALTAILYLNLQQPQQYERFRTQPAAYLKEQILKHW